MTNQKENFLFDISIVIPVFNSALTIERLIDQIYTAIPSNRIRHEVILIDDASHDSSKSLLKEIFLKYPNISVIELRKNSGQDNAIMAGLKKVSGQYAVIMDDDLQHDPKYIPILFSEVKDGADVCYANFLIKKQSFLKNFGSWFANKCANILLKKPKNIYLSPFKIIDSSVVEEIIKYQGPYPYVDGLIFRVTKNVKQVDVEHSERSLGEGNYTFLKSIKVWSNLATNFSILPLRLSIFCGFFTSICGFLLGGYFTISYFLNDQIPEGWSSLAVLVLFFGGIQLIAIGMIGEYLGRLFLLNNKEPQYVVKNIYSNIES
jgi:undecaprenyl-phosphate 4-deoxy-4-formamido-L-arabinose transferase